MHPLEEVVEEALHAHHAHQEPIKNAGYIAQLEEMEHDGHQFASISKHLFERTMNGCLLLSIEEHI